MVWSPPCSARRRLEVRRSRRCSPPPRASIGDSAMRLSDPMTRSRCRLSCWRVSRRPPPPPPAATPTRRAHLVDIAAVRSVYDTWARAQTGPLTRRTAPFTATDAELSESVTGITVAEAADGQPVGYAMWNRTRGPNGSALDVEDL